MTISSARVVLSATALILILSVTLSSTLASPAISSNPSPNDDHDNLVYEHMSGIAPYHDAPGANIRPPENCKIEAATFLFRHSSIYANDDEWQDFMKPFVERVSDFIDNDGTFPPGPLEFLNTWKSPIDENNLEQLTELGAKDSTEMGKRIRKLYPQLFPPPRLGKPRVKATKDHLEDGSGIQTKKKKNKDRDGVKIPFKVWTASSSRDINTAKSFVKGAFPKHHSGDDGEGDGKYVELVEVDNKDESWSTSLTPHKICDAFSKEPGKPDAREWLSHYGPEPLSRIQSLSPTFQFELDDIIAMQMLCGYESVINGIGKSGFCKKGLFKMEEFKDFGYWNDLIYNKIVGYQAKVSPFLGFPWLNTSLHNLLSVRSPDHKTPKHDDGNGLLKIFGKKDPDLPDSDGPPNSTHTQKLFAYFTHREEPPVALVALGLWNQTAIGPLPTDSRSENRVWKTSHVLPFLGHVALERISCRVKDEHDSRFSTQLLQKNFLQNLWNSLSSSGFLPFKIPSSFSSSSSSSSHSSHQSQDGKKHHDFVRVVVNGAVQPLPQCNSGPGKSCPLKEFEDYVKSRGELYGDFESACKVEEQH